MTAFERRDKIIEMLCEKRFLKIDYLANLFRACEKTIRRDILELSLSYPIYTRTGTYGGVYIADGYYRDKSYLSDLQKEILESVLNVVNESQAQIIKSIIDKFSKPEVKGGKK